MKLIRLQRVRPLLGQAKAESDTLASVFSFWQWIASTVQPTIVSERGNLFLLTKDYKLAKHFRLAPTFAL